VRHRAVPAALALLAALLAPPTAALDVPFLAGRVNDTAGMLTGPERERIEAKLEQLEASSGAQVAVLTVASLEGEAIETYALRVAETWQLGRREQDDGVLLLVARDDRALRLEVGYGLEAVLPDAVCRRIIDNVIVPRFRDGEFGSGIAEGVDAIAGTIEGRDVVPAEAPDRVPDARDMPWPFTLAFLGIFTVVIGMFSLVALFGQGCQGWFLYFFLMPFYFAFPLAALGRPAGLVPVVFWVVSFPILKLWLGHSAAGKEWLAGHPRWRRFATSTGRSSGGGWSSGGSSGGGFSGGGGSFGGGGASGGW
jgi:uncharacterized protein